MRRSGLADLPLHGGRCPPWLFEKMKALGGTIARTIVQEYGRDEFLIRIGDPFFFQALGCTLGFDWHSSGLTTTVCGALKEALSADLGIVVCGGKGRASKLTLEEIQSFSETFSLSSRKTEELKYASRMAAKVDNTCLQDGYQLYHHSFFMSEDGKWTVVQQGMQGNFARRYHWVSASVRSFVNEPHSGLVGDLGGGQVLDMTARESEEARRASVDIVCDNPNRLLPRVLEVEQRSLDEYLKVAPVPKLLMPSGHAITKMVKETLNALRRAHEIQPETYEELIAIRGIGPRAVRALALVSELIYGKPPSWKDPVKFSFSHGGKDGIPYPVDRSTYQNTIEMLESALSSAGIGQREQLNAIRRLSNFLK